MAEEENHIDQLFKTKLSNRVSAPPDDIWEGVESAIPKRLFFRFRYEQMNIYYSSMIACCFLFSGVSMVYSVKQYYKNLTPENTLIIDQDSTVKQIGDSSAAFKNNEKREKRKWYDLTSKNKQSEDENFPTLKDDEKDSLLSKEISVKADSFIVAKPVVIAPEVKPKKVKKIVYVMDYDTVVNYDTLRTKRKRK